MNSLTFPVVAQVFSGGHMMMRRYYSIFINNLFQSVCYFFKYEGSRKNKEKKAVQQLLICLETSVDKFAPLGIP